MYKKILFLGKKTYKKDYSKAIVLKAIKDKYSSITELPDSKAAYEKCKVSHFDIIIVDMKMPGQEEKQWLEKIRLEHEDIPIVMVEEFSGQAKFVAKEAFVELAFSGADTEKNKKKDNNNRDMDKELEAMLEKIPIEQRQEAEQQIRSMYEELYKIREIGDRIHSIYEHTHAQVEATMEKAKEYGYVPRP